MVGFLDALGFEEKGEGAASTGSRIDQEGESTFVLKCTFVAFSILLQDRFLGSRWLFFVLFQAQDFQQP
jgi:hypothetical protein